MAFEAIFQPIKIGPVEIKNRIAMAPMAIHNYSINGAPTNQAICYFNARAKGGTGLIIVGAIMGSKLAASELGRVSCLYDGSHMYEWTCLTESVHNYGAKVFAQLSPGFGRKALAKRPMGASPIPINMDIAREGIPEKMMPYTVYWPKGTPFFQRLHAAVPREMTIEEIEQTEEEFVTSSMLAIQCGFDGIEIHACHGYLCDQFLSPVANHRTDLYGGSLRDRARFLLECLSRTKSVFGDAVPVTVRISGSSRIEEYGGNGPEEMRQVAQWCEENGADAIHLSDGLTLERYNYEFPDVENTEPGRLIDIQGKKLKKVVKIPIITPSIHVPESVDRVITEGETDMVAMGRQSLADPEWVNKVKAGKLDKIIKCDRCYYCLGFGAFGQGTIITCLKNPKTGLEQWMPEYWPKAMKHKIPESLRRWKPGGSLVNVAGEE